MLRKALGNGTGAVLSRPCPSTGVRFSADVVVGASGSPDAAAEAGDAGCVSRRCRLRPLAVAAQSTPVRWRTGRWPGIDLCIHSRWFLRCPLVIPSSRGRAGRSDRSPELIATPLTAYQGEEVVPSLSPDGSQVAFARNGPRQDNYDIYVKLVGSGEPVTSHHRSCPRRRKRIFAGWTPDCLPAIRRDQRLRRSLRRSRAGRGATTGDHDCAELCDAALPADERPVVDAGWEVARRWAFSRRPASRPESGSSRSMERIGGA